MKKKEYFLVAYNTAYYPWVQAFNDKKKAEKEFKELSKQAEEMKDAVYLCKIIDSQTEKGIDEEL